MGSLGNLEDIPQFARFLVLRHIWPALIDSWGREPDRWIGQAIEMAERDPKGYFADAGLALKRMRACGVSPEDIASVVRMASYKTAFGVLDLIDTPDAPSDAPGMETYGSGPRQKIDGAPRGRLA